MAKTPIVSKSYFITFALFVPRISHLGNIAKIYRTAVRFTCNSHLNFISKMPLYCFSSLCQRPVVHESLHIIGAK